MQEKCLHQGHYSIDTNNENSCDWLTKIGILIELPGKSAEVAELADALRSGRSEHYAHVGSNPTFGINPARAGFFL